MAIYVYECAEHGEFEHAQPMTVLLPDLRKCPKCGRRSPRKQTPISIIVRDGTGAGRAWRETR